MRSIQLVVCVPHLACSMTLTGCTNNTINTAAAAADLFYPQNFCSGYFLMG